MSYLSHSLFSSKRHGASVKITPAKSCTGLEDSQSPPKHVTGEKQHQNIHKHLCFKQAPGV